jgi:hypothetical protein
MTNVWDYVSELRPPTGLMFITHMTYEKGEPRWNDTDRGEAKESEEDLSQCPWTDWPGQDPVPLL